MLRPELTLLLIIFVTGCLCEDATVIMMFPDDENFRKYTIAYMSIKSLPKIDSVKVSVAEQPEIVDIDKSTDPHRIMFRPDMLTGVSHLTVSVGSAVFTLHLIVERLPISTINSSVFLTGPTAEVKPFLLAHGLKNESDVRVITVKRSKDGKTDAVVQVYKAGSTTNFMPLWEAYEWLTKRIGTNSSIQLMPERCPASSDALCRCRLTFIKGRPSVHTAVLELGNVIKLQNFIGFDLSWMPQTVDKMHLESCGLGTCLNGGVCDTKFLGVGFRCKCPSRPNTPWGPRCEYPTKSYTLNEKMLEPLAFSRHWIGDLPHSTMSIKLSFEFSGNLVKSGKGQMLALKSSTNPTNTLLSISFAAKVNTLRVSGSFVDGKMVDRSINGLNAAGWFVIHIWTNPNWMQVVICPKNMKGSHLTTTLGCEWAKEKFNPGTTLSTDFRNLWLEIGQNFRGCVQSVAVNGYSVDMAAARIEGADASRITDYCSLQNSACTHPSNIYNYVCGNNSVCYGLVTNRNFPTTIDLDCNCKCLGSMRSESETVTGSGICNSKRACSKEPLILSTASANVSRWTLNGPRPLPLSEKEAMSIEIEFRTRSSKSYGILTGLIRDASGSQLQLQQLDITNGVLRQCLNSSVCWNYPPIRINDGEWHTVSATIKLDLLILTVDGVSSMYERGGATSAFKSLQLYSSIADSNLRNIRVSGIYMSMNNDTDRSVDPGGDFVVPYFPDDVIVYKVGINPAPSCECIGCPKERCMRLWGKTTCECETGEVKNSDDICDTIDPCIKFNIECPTNSECKNASSPLGFECICPVGIKNQLCVTGKYETLLEVLAQSTAVDLASMQWLVWLLAGIIGIAIQG